MNSSEALDAQVAAHDLVISLIPYTYHATVIKSAIKGKTHVVTTSYVSPAMRELDEAAKQAGIVVMNEIGLDPGIDHLYAIKTISEVHEKGGKVGNLELDCRKNKLIDMNRSRSFCPTAVAFLRPSVPETLWATNSLGLLEESYLLF